MSKIEVNTVAPQCGTTLTLGESGDTVTLGSGASQSGFGRTGTVDWQTTKKTTDFTAVNGEGYFVDTGSGVVTVTLPASPSAGNIVYIKDYDGNFGTNKCTIARNGSNIRGATDNIDLDANNAGVVCIYVDATEGWQLFFDGSDADARATFITATGGTEVTCGNFKTHIFTGPGTFTVSCTASNPTNNTLDYLVVAGGGGGGGNNPAGPTFGTGGGGAGGMRLSNSLSLPAPTMSPLSNPSGITAAAQSYAITVGSGGGGGVYPGVHSGSQGNPSTFGPITSAGGGFGTWGNTPGSNGGNPGGSGGGSGRDLNIAGGTGNTPPVSPPQGNNGAASFAGPYGSAGGGGGAGQAGQQGTTSNSPTSEIGGDGGAGSYIADGFVGPSAPTYGTPGPVGSTRYFAGGGGGGYWNNPAGRCTAAGDGGVGGGGQANASNPDSTAGTAGTANTGGGGGGAVQGGAGGSGIVMIRYRRQ
jgi:hypothetical protein